jgi:type I restriction enzyme S subunit
VKHPPYPSYKPSGVEWLGDVPGHWEVKRLKYSATINDEVLPETTEPDFEFSYVDISSVDGTAGIIAQQPMTFEIAPSRARRVVRNGDTIVSTVRTYLRAIAPINNPPDTLIVSTGFAVVRPRSVQPRFLFYAIRKSSFVETVVARSVGVSYPAVNASEVATIPVPFCGTGSSFTARRFASRILNRHTGLIGTCWRSTERTNSPSRAKCRATPVTIARRTWFSP